MESTSEIITIIRKWLNDVLRNETIPDSVVALNFNIQRTYNEFEMYVTGHDDFYHDHDTWLLSEVYVSKENFKGLGVDSLKLSDQDMYSIYQKEVIEFLKERMEVYPENIHYFTCNYPVGMPELLLER